METIKKWLKNNQGITLLEILLAITILSMVLILISQVQIMGQKQFINESNKVNHLENVRLAAKIITKEIRKENAFVIDGERLIIGTDEYKLEGTDIVKNGTPFIHYIDDFQFSALAEGIDIEIISVADIHGKKESISTTIYLRR